MSRSRYPGRLALAAAILGIVAFVFASPVVAQRPDELFSGDSVRVNLRIVGLTTGERIQLQQQLKEQEDLIADLRRDLQTEERELERMMEELGLNELGAVVNQTFVGRVLSVDGRSLTVIARAAPKCRAGLMYGDAPICDPAPMSQRTMDLGQVSIERRQTKDHVGARMVVAGVLGGAAFGALGYAVGPNLGFGKVGGCTEVTGTSSCSAFDGLTAEEIVEASERQEVDQKISDQRRGALFFGLLGSTASVMLARQLSVGWVEVHPTSRSTANSHGESRSGFQPGGVRTDSAGRPALRPFASRTTRRLWA